jgi:Tfp pilus assembly protein FimT
VAIIALAGALSGMQLSGAADKLASDLRYAQTMASGTGTWYGVSFEADPTNRYALYTTDGTTDTYVDDPAKRGKQFIVDTQTDYAVIIGSITIEGGGRIEFSPIGAPYRDKLGAVLTQEAVIGLRKGSALRTVRVTPGTGRIAVQ